MGFIRIKTSKYGLDIQIEILKINTIIRIFKRFDLEDTLGIRNSCYPESSARLLFLDYDNMLYKEQLIPELKWLQQRYELSSFFIFKSSQKIGAYHIICLDKLTPREWAEIIPNTNVDQNYKLVPIYKDNKAWVLRFIPKRESNKPKLIKIMTSPHNQRQKSLAHALFLKYNYGIDISKIKNLDKNTKTMITIYPTLNYIKEKNQKI